MVVAAFSAAVSAEKNNHNYSGRHETSEGTCHLSDYVPARFSRTGGGILALWNEKRVRMVSGPSLPQFYTHSVYKTLQRS